MINLICSFQDNEKVYFVLELLKGGDLRYHMNNNYKKINEIQLKFLVQNLIIVLEYIHRNNIIHRDIKPENLIFDNEGYIHLNDFGVARSIYDNTSGDISGSLGYIAPETLFRNKQKFISDFYSIGIICYEIIKGKRPYISRKYNLMKSELIFKKAFIDINNVENENNFYSEECIRFINGLLIRDPGQRLGNENGIIDLKNHLWLKNDLWGSIFNKDIESPFMNFIIEARKKLNTIEIYDKEYVNELGLITKDYIKDRYKELKLSKEYKYGFKNLDYIYLESYHEDILFPSIDWPNKNYKNLKNILLRKNNSFSLINDTLSESSTNTNFYTKKKNKKYKKKNRKSNSVQRPNKNNIENIYEDNDSALFLNKETKEIEDEHNSDMQYDFYENPNVIKEESIINFEEDENRIPTKIEDYNQFNNIVLENFMRFRKRVAYDKNSKVNSKLKHFFKSQSCDEIDFTKLLDHKKYILAKPLYENNKLLFPNRKEMIRLPYI